MVLYPNRFFQSRFYISTSYFLYTLLLHTRFLSFYLPVFFFTSHHQPPLYIYILYPSNLVIVYIHLFFFLFLFLFSLCSIAHVSLFYSPSLIYGYIYLFTVSNIAWTLSSFFSFLQRRRFPTPRLPTSLVFCLVCRCKYIIFSLPIFRGLAVTTSHFRHTDGVTPKIHTNINTHIIYTRMSSFTHTKY